MKHQQLAAAALAAGSLALLAACGGDDKKNGDASASTAANGSPAAKKVDVELVALAHKNPFYQSLICGAQGEADKLGVKLNVAQPAEPTPEKQLPALRAAIAKDPDVIVIGPVDRKAITPTLHQAIQKGIKIIDVDQVLDDTSGITSVIATDQYALGMQAAKTVVAGMNNTGKAVIVTAPPGFPALDDRARGFAKGLEGTGVTLKATLRDKTFSPNGTAALVKAATSDPSVTGFYSTYGTAATGVVSVARTTHNDDKWTIVSTDTEAPSMAQLKAGSLDAIMGQQPGFVGSSAIDQAYKAATGAPVTAKISAPATVITQKNTDAADVYRTQASCS
jgi:ribose transport system substrate-binding protein